MVLAVHENTNEITNMLQTHINLTKKWFTIRKIKVNHDKCNHVAFIPRKSKIGIALHDNDIP